MSKLPNWDLSALYKNPSDPKIFNDLTQAKKLATDFSSKFRGKINEKITPLQLKKATEAYESLFLLALKPVDYAALIHSTDSLNPALGVLLQRTQQFFLEIRSKMLFFELEMSKISDAKLSRLASTELLSNYKHFLETILKTKKHKLKESAEKIFNDKSLITSAFVRLFNQHHSKKKYFIKLKGKKIQASQEDIMSYLEDENRSARKAASEAFSSGVKEDEQMLALIYNTIIKDKAISDQYRKFSSPEEARHIDNEVSQDIVNTMIQVVSENYNVVKDFYKFKRKVMGLKQLETYDRYAPISKTKIRFSYNQARSIVLKSFQKFHPQFYNIANKFFDNNWIDAEVKVGKRGGAFCSYVTPDLHPVVFINFKNKARDIKTLAHELGHGINGYLMRKQTLVNYDQPLTLAETASVFCEMLVFDDLKNSITEPEEKFDLYVSHVQNIFGTVFLQTAMFLFERDVHNLQKTEGELTPERFSELWGKRQREMFGNSINISENTTNRWATVPHFIQTPFYVYAYAFGLLLVYSLYAQYKKNPKQFVPKYLKFLSAGNSMSPEELLKPFGINLRDKKFWEQGILLIKDLVKETKAIYRKM